MSIENPRFNQPSPENESGEALTPEKLLAHVRDNEELPTLDPEELQQLNDAMTQEQVLEYYSIVNSLENQAVLDQWIPKPKVMYHASRAGNVKEFEPRDRYKRRGDDPPQVFAGSSKAIAAMMLGPGGDEWSKSGSYDGQRTWTYIYTDTEEFREGDTGGYIYELPSDDFTCDPHLGLGTGEWTSTKPVKPLGQPRHYPSGIEAMLQHGVKVYPVDEATMKRFRDKNQDDYEILKTLRPIN